MVVLRRGILTSKVERTDKGWVLCSGRINYALDIFPDGSLRLNSLQNMDSEFEWAATGEYTGIYIENTPETMAGFSGENGFRLFDESTRTLNNGAVELQISMFQESSGMKITSFFTCFPEVAVIEFRCRIENLGSEPLPAITRFNPLCIRLRGDLGPLQVNCIGDDVNRIMFMGKLETASLFPESPFSPEFVALEDTKAHEILFFAGECGGGVFDWSLNLQRQSGHILLYAGAGRIWSALKGEWPKRIRQYLLPYAYTTNPLEEKRPPNYVLAPDESVESPEVFIGLTDGDLDDACNEMRYFLSKFILPKPVENFPWLVYQIFLTESDIEGILLEELEFAAKMGFECFSIDASWYEGSSTVPGMGDWATGLGNYTESREKFPHGMKYLSQKVHEKGLKFGIWVSPTTVDRSLIESGKILRKWIAQFDGIDLEWWDDNFAPMIQLCLGNPEVFNWVKENLSRIISEWQVDWLKWDSSPTVNYGCNCADHGHKEGNGAYAFSQVYLEIMSYLLERFPNLVGWEGIRTLRYGRANHGYGYILPGYTFQFVAEPMMGPRVWGAFSHSSELTDIYYSASYLDYFFRKRLMSGLIFINCWAMASQRLSLAPPGFLEALKRNIRNFKIYRHLLFEDVYHLQLQRPEKWNAIEYCKRDGTEAVVFIFREGSSEGKNQISLRGLNKSAAYLVTSLNKQPGRERTMSGDELVNEGIKVELPDPWLAVGFNINLDAMDPEHRKQFQKQLQYGSDILILRKIK